MEIKIEQDVPDDMIRIDIKIPQPFLADKCDRHPMAHLITQDQGMGIIRDSVLLALGYEERKNNE